MKNSGQDSDLEKLGDFFRRSRIGRGITLAEASGEWSATTLSRFERGEVDISTDKAISLMLRIGMNELDLLELTESNYANFPLNLQDDIQLNNKPKIERRYRDYLAAHTERNTVTDLARVMFEAALHWPEAFIGRKLIIN